VKKIKFYSGDILACFLIDRLHLTPIRFALISGILALGYGYLCSWASNTLNLFMKEWIGWVWGFLVVPMLMGYYLWGSNSMEGLIKDLQKSDIIDISDSDMNLALSTYQKSWRMFFSFVLAVITSVAYFKSRAYTEAWTSINLIAKFTSTIAYFVGSYLMIMLILTLITNYRTLRQILHNKRFNLNPLHPDRCGGLKSLSEYSLKTASLAIVFCVMIVLMLYQFRDTEVYKWIMLGIPLYVVIASTCFFAPLITAHTKMKEAKDKLLSSISKQFQEDYLYAQKELNGNAEKLKEAVAKIQQTQTLHDLIDQFPVWPFNAATFRKFSIFLITPLLPFFFELLKRKLMP
jgi:hypothetical protein